MRVLTVVGARPQFIKAAPVRRALESAGHTEILVHTGQHYDEAMSAAQFRDLELASPQINLGIGSGHHGAQTARMLAGLEEILLEQTPDWVLVYGDTNSTLAGALAAAKLRVPVAHVEAGQRSYNRCMPEETNRVLTDHVSDLLLCSTPAAVANLAAEGIHSHVHMVGDVMIDALGWILQRTQSPGASARMNLASGSYLLATVHRAENTDHSDRLRAHSDDAQRAGRARGLSRAPANQEGHRTRRLGAGAARARHRTRRLPRHDRVGARRSDDPHRLRRDAEGSLFPWRAVHRPS